MFANHFLGYLKNAFIEINKYSSDLTESNEPQEILKINAMCILYHNMFGNIDDKLFKQLIECNNKVIYFVIVIF